MANFEVSFPAIVLSLTIVCLTAIALYFIAARMQAPNKVKALSWALLGGHCLLGIALVDSGLAESGDAAGYDLAGRNIAAFLGGESRLAQLTSAGKQGWPWLLGVLYWVGAPSLLIAIAVNAAALSVIPLVFFHLMNRVHSQSAGVRAAVLASISPAWWFWGSLPIREAVNLLFLSVFVVALCLYTHRRHNRYIAYMLLAAVGVNYFRGSLAVILIATALVVVPLSSGKGVLRGRAPSVVAVPLMLLLAGVGQSAYSSVGGSLSSERAAEIRHSQSTRAASGFAVDQGGGAGLVGAAQQIVRSLPQVALGPYPWHLVSIPSYAPDVIFWWVLLWLAWRGGRSPAGRKLRLPLVLLALGLMAALAVYSGNFGTLIRLRAQLVPVVIPLAALGLLTARRSFSFKGTSLGLRDDRELAARAARSG